MPHFAKRKPTIGVGFEFCSEAADVVEQSMRLVFASHDPAELDELAAVTPTDDARRLKDERAGPACVSDHGLADAESEIVESIKAILERSGSTGS